MTVDIPRESDEQLAEFLVSYGLLEEDQLNHEIASCKKNGGGILENLIDKGFLEESTILQSIGDAYDLEVTSIGGMDDIEADVRSLFPVNFLIKNRVVPLKKKGGALKVAISETSALNAISLVRVLTGLSVQASIISLSEMKNVLTELSGQEPEEIPYSIEIAPEEQVEEVPDHEAKSSLVIDLVDRFIAEAIHKGVSDIHLEPFKHSARLRFRLDGVLQDRSDYATELFDRYSAIVTRIKIMSSLDIAERRLPQDGAITIKVSNREVDLRVSVLPTSFGERVVMRILDRSSISLTIEKLNLDPQDESALIAAIESPQGLVLVTGPTGSGKSTTLYAALGRINSVGINILTAEDPVEYSVEGIGQVQIKDDIGLTFSAALRSFLRQDPEAILVGEIRDKETVDIAIKAALTGHLVLSTLHTNDAVSSISRLLNMGVPPYLLTSSLSLVVAQRLVRMICGSCKTEDTRQERDRLQAMGFSIRELAQAHVYRGAGCAQCDNIGSKGRSGIYEVLRVTDNIKEGILKGKTTMELLQIAKEKDQFRTLQEIGKGLVLQGLISVDEYQRVLMLV